MADAVQPAPPAAPYEDIALLWCVEGVEQMEVDPEGAAACLVLAVAYGSNDAMAWLGGALIDHALINGDIRAPEWQAVVIDGLRWLDLAHCCGVAFANNFFTVAKGSLPASILDAWAAHPERFPVPVQ